MPMNSSSDLAHRRVYLLADHLDAILAAGEDLRKLITVCHRKSTPKSDQTATVMTLNELVRRARTLEIAAIGRVKQAREHAQFLATELTRRDNRFGLLAQLFAAGTATVVDAIDDICDNEKHAFTNCFDPLVYLRARGLISEDCGCLAVVEEISIEDTFLLAGQIELGALLDMCATFLDVLEENFELFPEVPLDAPTMTSDVTTEATP